MNKNEATAVKKFFEKIKPKIGGVLESLKNPVIQADIQKSREKMSKQDFEKSGQEGRELANNLVNSILQTIKTKSVKEKQPSKSIGKRRKKVKFK